ERFAEVEHADLDDARVAHFARGALEQLEVHVPFGLHFARAQGAEPAAVVAARRDLDLDAFRRGRRGLQSLRRDQGDAVDAVGDRRHGAAIIAAGRRRVWTCINPAVPGRAVRMEPEPERMETTT